MVLSAFKKKAFLLMLLGLISMILLLTACGKAASQSTPVTGNTNTPTNTQATVTKLIILVDKPTAQLVSGSTFEVDGQVKNSDTKQHDITLQATLFDASGKAITTVTKLVDNVPGGTIAKYAITGTTPLTTWQTVQVTIIKVSENINSSDN
jgi:hypothetical protein